MNEQLPENAHIGGEKAHNISRRSNMNHRSRPSHTHATLMNLNVISLLKSHRRGHQTTGNTIYTRKGEKQARKHQNNLIQNQKLKSMQNKANRVGTEPS